jgi:hypothetical protein
MIQAVNYRSEESLSAALRRGRDGVATHERCPESGQLPEESVVKRLIRWDSSANAQSCPSCSQYHFTVLRERPVPEASPSSAGGRQVSHFIQADTFTQIQCDRLRFGSSSGMGRCQPALKDGPTTRPLRASSTGREVAEITSK